MYAKNITKYLIFSVAIITTINAMELPKKKSARQKLPQQSLIEIFTGIKKEHYEMLLSDLKKIVVHDVLVPQLINKPWHFVEHKINNPALAVRFAADNKLLFADYNTVNWFDCQKGCITKTVPYNNFESFVEVCFDKTGQCMAVVNSNGGYIADISNTEKPVIEIQNKTHPNSSINSVCCNYDNSILIIALKNGHIVFYDMQTGECKNHGAYGPVGSINGFCSSAIELKSALVTDKNKIIIGNNFHHGRIVANKQWVIKTPGSEEVSSLCFNYNGKQLLVGFYNGEISVFDVDAKQKLWALFFTQWFRSLCFDEHTNRIALGGSGYTDTYTYIIAQYDTYTLEQLLLRKLMHFWLLWKKPHHHINSLKRVFKNIALLFNVDHAELGAVWTTFPPFMQKAIEETMLARVKKYKHRGKKKFHLYNGHKK